LLLLCSTPFGSCSRQAKSNQMAAASFMIPTSRVSSTIEPDASVLESIHTAGTITTDDYHQRRIPVPSENSIDWKPLKFLSVC
jgi:hypothetical protein